MRVELSHVTKSFYGVKALDDVQITLQSGEVNCLVGENGAGKSTLIKILAGDYIPESGVILLDDRKVVFHSPKDAQMCKIAVMHQELMLVPEMTVAENIALGRWPVKGVLTNQKAMIETAAEALQKLGSAIDPRSKISALSTAQHQMVEIARAISQDIQVLVMDEPTAALSEVDARKFLELVGSLRKQGMAILYVSHRMEEVFDIADRITVFRDGKYVASDFRKNLMPADIIKMMVGHAVDYAKVNERNTQRGEKVLEAKSLHGRNFCNISFSLYEGEVLGLAGLVGSGRTEILRAIFGADRFYEGELEIFGKKKKFLHPCEAMEHGVMMVPEDRKLSGLILIRSVQENMTLTVLAKVSKWGFVRAKRQKELAQKYRNLLRVKTNSLDTPVMFLSGGNQQKVLLGRSLAAVPRILLLDEPTRGVDVGAREEIHAIIDEAVANRMAVLLVSSDILELIGLSDRVLVLKEGKMAGEFADNRVTKEEVLSLATV